MIPSGLSGIAFAALFFYAVTIIVLAWALEKRTTFTDNKGFIESKGSYVVFLIGIAALVLFMYVFLAATVSPLFHEELAGPVPSGVTVDEYHNIISYFPILFIFASAGLATLAIDNYVSLINLARRVKLRKPIIYDTGEFMIRWFGPDIVSMLLLLAALLYSVFVRAAYVDNGAVFLSTTPHADQATLLAASKILSIVGATVLFIHAYIFPLGIIVIIILLETYKKKQKK